MSGFLAGIASMSINGEAWDVVSDLHWRPDGLKLETLKGQTRVEGAAAMPLEGVISATLRDRGAEAIKPFVGMNNVTVVVQVASGKTIYGDGMWVTNVGEVRSQEGTFEIQFEGQDVSESPT